MTKLKATLLSTALLAIIATPAMAMEGKKTKEIKEIVGYNVTEKQEFGGKRASTFRLMDRNNDGAVNFKEFQNYSTVDNEYEIFSLIDTDQSKSLSLQEYGSANVTKGSTHFDSALHGRVKGTNLKTRRLPEMKSYYEPVTPTVVEVKDLKTGEVSVGVDAEMKAKTPAYAR